MITARYLALESVLNEHERRLYGAVEAKYLGMETLSGSMRNRRRLWIDLAGLKELAQGGKGMIGEPRRVRRASTGRKSWLKVSGG